VACISDHSPIGHGSHDVQSSVAYSPYSQDASACPMQVTSSNTAETENIFRIVLVMV
jgi:hypothetical protein